MRKGEVTRQAVLERATALASQVGLSGLTIGRLAEELELSKSGLFAHFRSKEALEVQVLEHAAERFVDVVIQPALKAPRGEPRVRAFFDRWRRWPKENPMPGGCLFIAAAIELDDRPGPARDLLVKQQKDLLDVIASTVKGAVSEGHFREDVDPEQFAHDLYAVMLGYHHSWRLLRDPKATERALRAFENLILAARKPQ